MVSSLKRILITNDDSYVSPGLYILYDAVKDLGEVLIFSTEYPRSVIGHTITISRPLRVYETEVHGYRVVLTDGTPIDVIHLAIEVLGYVPDLVLSGVNVGDNLTLQHIFYSGTVAAAIEASLLGIPAIAFSAQINSFNEFDDPKLREVITGFARKLVTGVLEKGWIPGIDVINVNFPNIKNYRNCVRITKAAKLRWRAAYDRRVDPRMRPYYWLYTKPIEAGPGTDVYAVDVEGCISVTPLSIDLNLCSAETFENTKKELEKILLS